ncbi:MAG TPA: glycosyltransferase family 87 protein [Chloroflexota bacterium]|nr:glycosyltransferase family 87 protein [Chloroflexota bacterium]
MIQSRTAGVQSRYVPVATVVGLATALAFLLLVARPAATHLTHGFSAYDTAARLLLEGQSPIRFYDDDWFRQQTIRLGFAGADDIYNLNPPTTALLLWPLAGLDPISAKVAWTALNLSFLALALFGLVHLTRGGLPAAVVGVVIVAVFQPVREEIGLGQAYALLLALEVALLWADQTRRDPVVGLVLGTMLSFKTAGIALPGLLLAQRRWRALDWTALTGAAIVAITLPWLGVEAWGRYLSLLSRFGGQPEIAVTAYQDLPGVWLHLFRFDQIWNPAPLVVLPWLALILLAATAFGLVGYTTRVTWATEPPSAQARTLAFAAWASLSLVLSPVSEDYHYTLLLVPIAIVLADWRDSPRSWRTATILALAVFLVGAPLPYKAPALTAGAWALLAYPKLYGALLIWWLSVSALRRDKRRRA